MTGYIKKIDKINFGLLSPEDIRAMSVVTVETPDTYEDNGFPIAKGLMDTRLGVTDPSLVCRTCGMRGGDCQGHFGSIELARPVIHIGFGDVIHKILRSTCNECGRVLLSNDQIEEYTQKIQGAMDNRESLNNILKEVYRTAKIETKNLPAYDEEVDPKHCCPHCGAPQEAISLDKPVTIRQGDYKLTAYEVRERLERISDEDAFVLGVNPEVARPEWLVLTVLPVPPVTMRPSITLDTGERSEDDLTHKLVDILRINQRLLENMEAGAPNLIVEDLWELLQYHVTTYFDNEASGVPPARHRSGRPFKTLTQRLKGKEGRFRSNLSGKRVNFSARTVISPDPNISINEVGVPEMIAKEVTVPVYVNEWNMDEMIKYIKNGPDVHPGANYVIRKDGRKIRVRNEETMELLLEQLEPGFLVERHLKDGDIVLFNRQPSLHRMSMMAHEVRVLPYKTFRLNPCVCPPYNADFDGDEMNMHVFQSIEARAEAKSLLRVQEHILSPRFGGPIIGAIHDHITGAFLLTRNTSVFSEEEALQIIRKSHLKMPELIENQWVLKYDSNFGEESFIYKNKGDAWTGKELFSLLLPNDLNLEYAAEIAEGKEKTVVYEYDEESGKKLAKIGYKDLVYPTEGYVVIKNGILLQGVIDESAFGSFSGKILDKIVKEYGPGRAKEFLDKSTDMAIYAITKFGITTSFNDEEIPEEAQDRINWHLDKKMDEVDKFVEAYEEGYLQALSGRSLEETLEMRCMQVLGEARDISGSIAAEYILNDDDSSLFSALGNNSAVMAKTGARSSMLNLTQITACVGQQAVRGGRIERGYLGRTLPHFKKGELGAKAKGFVHSSYKSGLDPIEFFFHAMGGREGLVDTAIRTAQSGYMQRRLVNALQDLSVDFNGVVKDNEGNVIQTLFGDDGVDPAKSDFGKPADLDRIIKEIKLNNTELINNDSIVDKDDEKQRNYNKIKIKLNKLIRNYEIFIKNINNKIEKEDEQFINGLTRILNDSQKKYEYLSNYYNRNIFLSDLENTPIFINDYSKYLNEFKQEYNNELKDIKFVKKSYEMVIIEEKIYDKNQLLTKIKNAFKLLKDDYLIYQKELEKLNLKINSLTDTLFEKNYLLNELQNLSIEISKSLNIIEDFENKITKYELIETKSVEKIEKSINEIKEIFNNFNNVNWPNYELEVKKQQENFKQFYYRERKLNKSEDIKILLSEFNRCINNPFLNHDLRKFNLPDEEFELIKTQIIEDICNKKITDKNSNFKLILLSYCEEHVANKNILKDDELNEIISDIDLTNIPDYIIDECKSIIKQDFFTNRITKEFIPIKFNKLIDKKYDEIKNLNELDDIKTNPNLPVIKQFLSKEDCREIYDMAEEKICSEYGLRGSVLSFVETQMYRKNEKNKSEAREEFKRYRNNTKYFLEITNLSEYQIESFIHDVEILIGKNKIKTNDFDEKFLQEISLSFKTFGRIILR